MAAELKGNDNWVPLTPAKLVQSPVNLGKERFDVDCELGNSSCHGACFSKYREKEEKFDSTDCNIGVGSDLGGVGLGNACQRPDCLSLDHNSNGFTGGISDKLACQETAKVDVPSCIRGIQIENKHIHCDSGMHSTTVNPSDAPSHPVPNKPRKCGVSINRKKRPKMKRHRPKIYDESKLKKTLKLKINPLTPKNKTPKLAIHRATPTERGKNIIKENLRNTSDGSCRQKLDFNLENHAGDQKGHHAFCENEGMNDFEVLGTYLQKNDHTQMQDGIQLLNSDFNVHVDAVDPIFDDAAESCTFSVNEIHARQERGYPNFKKFKESFTEAMKLDFDLDWEVQDFDNCLGIQTIMQEYCQKNISINPVQEEDLGSDKNTPTTMSAQLSGHRFSDLQVYKRICRPNECLKNSRKMGPNVPKIYKRKRMKRKRATEFNNFLLDMIVEPCAGNVKKNATRRTTGKFYGGKCLEWVRSDPNTTIKYNLTGIRSTRRKRINHRLFFACARSLYPMPNLKNRTLNKKRKRCATHFSAEKGIAEEMKHAKLQHRGLSITWLIKRKRSKTTTRLRNLSSFFVVSKKKSKRNIGVLTKGKRHKKFEDSIKVRVKDRPCLDAQQLIEVPVVGSQYNMLTFHDDTPMEIKIDCISMMFETLHINDACNQLVVRDQNVNGALIPHTAKVDPSKRRKILAKVDLDAETMRVWNLLMENDGSQSIMEIYGDTAKTWQDQSEIFRGRIDSFISCMHLVQGDRRFSPWKGSVVDSVVGVFLTQNVSDHLSSSAFMSMAARFPPQSTSKQNDSNENSVCHQESVDNKESECPKSVDRNNEQPFLSSTEVDGKEDCTCSTSKSLGEHGIICSDACHMEPVDNKNEQSMNRNNEKPCLSSKIDVKEDGICSTSKSLGIDGIVCAGMYHQEPVDNNEFKEQSMNRSNGQPSLCSTNLDMKEDCICSTSQSLGGNGIICNDACHKEAIVEREFECEQSGSRYNEQPCLSSIKLDIEEDCVCSSFKSLGEHGLVCGDASQQESVDSKESDCVQFINKNNEQLCLSSTEVHMKGDWICSTPKSLEDGTVCNVAIQNIQGSFGLKSLSTDSRNCSSENSPTFREGLLVEENAFLQQFYSHEEDAITHDKSLNDAKFGDENVSIADSSSSKCSTTIPSLSKAENSATFREVLHEEETEFLQQANIQGNNEIGFGESIDNIKFRELQNRVCNLTSDQTFNPDSFAGSSSSLFQNFMEDIGETKVEGKNHESTTGRKKRQAKEKQEIPAKWDDLRKAYACDRSKDVKSGKIDSVNWEAVRQAPVVELAKVIAERGMNNILAGRIKDFLDRMVEDHGTIDLEWLRDVPPDKAKDYLLSIPGLGLKSTECVRLLTLRHHAFPVDTNVGRILVRLGWVPLLPLPEDVQIHLLNQYPLVDSIQKYIWPRLSTFSKQTLYECHYQMITFGKVFCTKRQPNCNVCPMRGQCRHFASAYASARLRLRGSEEKSAESESQQAHQNQVDTNQPLSVHFDGEISETGNKSCLSSEPVIEFPPSPKPDPEEMAEWDIEDFNYDKENEIPTIDLCGEEFEKNILDFMEKTNFLRGEEAMSKELVALNPRTAAIPMPQLKSVLRLRTVHQVYELPDSHHLLTGFEKREPDDPCPYLLAVWLNDSAANSSQLPRNASSCQEPSCDVDTCCSGDAYQKHDDEYIQGTILIPCRTANKGSFPLNGTYFQVNEVFADHVSSRHPLSVPRKFIWNLRRRSLYCGTSTTSIFRGMTTEEIQFCFWRGFICVRGFDWVRRAPRPLAKRFHFCKTRQVDEE